MQLRPYQKDACASVFEALIKRKADPLVVMPTGSGKSLVIAELARYALETWGVQSLVLCHRKELIEQNASKVRALLPGIDVGIYSAGLKARDVDAPIVIAGIQSCFRAATNFGSRPLVIIDEAHLIAPGEKTRFQTFFKELAVGCPRFRKVGLTATPFRTEDGCLAGAKLFTEVCYEAGIPDLIAAGYLAEVTNRGATEIDTTGVRIRAGEFVSQDAERAFMSSGVVGQAVREIVAKTSGRKSIVVFCCGVDHAEAVAKELEAVSGDRVGVITGDTPTLIRSGLIESFRAGSLRWLVNVDVLTTGFDAPGIDAIAVLRPTQSAGLFAQIVGRGFRIAPDKENCLLLDFGGNLKRHGCLDDPDYGKVGSATGPRSKECPGCGAANWLRATTCRECGTSFPEVVDEDAKECRRCGRPNPKDAPECLSCGESFAMKERETTHETKPDEEHTLLKAQAAKMSRYVAVVSMSWSRHKGKAGKPDTLRATYEVENLDGDEGNILPRTISEWTCPEHEGFPQKKFREWFARSSKALAPGTIDEAIGLRERGAVIAPAKLFVEFDGKYWTISGRVFEDERPEWDETKNNSFEEENECLPF